MAMHECNVHRSFTLQLQGPAWPSQARAVKPFQDDHGQDRPIWHQRIWISLETAVVGLILMACVLLGVGAQPIAMAASTPPEPTLESAVDRYLVSMPGDYYAVRTVPALKRLIGSDEALLVDVRQPSEYQAGHISGAINIPLKDLEHRLNLIPTDQAVVLYCSTGYRSAMGVMALQLQGFDQVRGFPPSFAGWQSAGEPVSRLDPSGEIQAGVAQA
ncbi:rhodanese-like domain-containing protein [Cyanobium sp. NS01]|uniref:rhodanese-like domain-containing protein n=1 Tax=Cyanobium sp. NS01 TaxID=261284 RepID=UPI001CED0792|nr:rhodanese-like domain-containing protein [Cyanobium sp. NS01]